MSTRTRRARPTARPTPRSGSFAPIAHVPIPRPRGGRQEALFGDPAAPASVPEQRADHGTADPDLIATVLRLAVSPGYLLLGPAERVVRPLDGRPGAHGVDVQAVPGFEADTVAQLLDARHLRLGGVRQVTHGGHLVAATTVTVSTAGRRLLDRWTATRTVRKAPHR
ncbi:MAG: hypothetical protein ACT4RN_21460 [Pseudonocardia sp.]